MADTIGRQLKLEREKRNLTIAKVVEGTRIRAHYIEALEDDDFEALPSPAQTRGFLRLYADFLGLSLDDLIARQRSDPSGAFPPAGEMAKPDGGAASPVRPAGEVPAASAGGQATADVPAGPQTKKRTASGKRIAPAKSRSQAKPAPEPPAPAEPGRQISIQSGPAKPPQPEAAPASQPGGASQVIFTSIGDQLRTRREALSLTLDEIEHHIHVRKQSLLALEAGEFHLLPSSVQARGMLNNYARFLDMDADAILLRFADGLQAQLHERQKPAAPKHGRAESKSKPNRPFKLQFPGALRRYLSPDMLVGVGLVLVLLLFAIWGTTRVIDLRTATTPQPTPPGLASVLTTPLASTETPTPTTAAGSSPAAPAGGSTPVIAIPTGGPGAVQIVVVALNSSWVRVTVDGKVKFEGRTALGTAYTYGGNTQIEVLTGDGSAVKIVYDQNDLGPMGNFGEVVDRIYTLNGILNPTPTFTPTFTQTPIPSPTLRPTATPRPSPTSQPH